jgi:superoxide dismutase, Cu-Zn family
MRTLKAKLAIGFIALAVIAGCQSQSVNREAKDATITAAVKAKLAADVRVTTLGTIDVSTNNGAVSLEGTVENENVKQQAEQAAKGVEGVMRVTNNLQVAPKTSSAEAELLDSSGKSIGKASLTEQSDDRGVKIHLTVQKLPPGVHGIHIHEVGQCQGPDFASAGKHFNPDNKQHGADNPKGQHAGDLGSIEIEPNGSADVNLSAPQVTLKEGANSLLRPGGTAIIIHAKRDDQKTDPSGNSGKPIACGAIRAGTPAPPIVPPTL